MNIKIRETGKTEILCIRNEHGIEWTQDLVGNAGAFVYGQFEWSEDDDAYLVGQDDYDWWAKYIADAEATDTEAHALADELGISYADVQAAIERSMDGVNDYDQHRRAALAAFDDLREQYAA